MKNKAVFILILSSGLLFFLPSYVKSETEITVSPTGVIRTIKQGIRAEIMENKETFMEKLETEREARKTKIEEMRTTFKTEREDFKEKMNLIKDQRRKKLTENIDNRMSTVNKNQTARMTKALEKLTEHLTKLEERVKKAKENGVDTSTVESLISAAKTAISSATAIVEEQAAKDYVFTITDEKNLGQSIKSAYETLSKDLRAAQAALVKAKEAVVAAYKAAAQLEKITPTTSVTPTP
jgi:hypothetical protein